MDVKTATDVGRLRENNEDALWVGEHCLVVCDGMGACCRRGGLGLGGGSHQVIPFGAGRPQEEVLAAIERAQARILEEAGRNRKYRGMGSTITLAWISGPGPDGLRELVVGHVGTAAATFMPTACWSSSPATIRWWVSSCGRGPLPRGSPHPPQAAHPHAGSGVGSNRTGTDHQAA